MIGPPGIVVIAPGIGAGLYGVEAVTALRIGDATACTKKVRIERSAMLIRLMDVASCGIGLPDLQKRIRLRPAILIKRPGRLRRCAHPGARHSCARCG